MNEEEGTGLQGILSSSSALLESRSTVLPHHPVTCAGELAYHPDGTLVCEHATAPAEDLRTQLCLHYSVSLLLIELASEL